MTVIFIDDGGVMNDNNIRELQWQVLVAKFFSPRYGGSMENWRAANKYAIDKFMNRYEKLRNNPTIDYNRFQQEENIIWLTNMFNHVNLIPPPYQQRSKIARAATDWITPQIKASYPGVIETVQVLQQEGFTLCTASGSVSWELNGYLTGMGVVDCFDKLYGPDLVNTAKAGTIFYQRIFADFKITPNNAIVIDDSVDYLTWAVQSGATTIHVLDESNCNKNTCMYHVSQLKEVPHLIIDERLIKD